jgi:hypothetical protein
MANFAAVLGDDDADFSLGPGCDTHATPLFTLIPSLSLCESWGRIVRSHMYEYFCCVFPSLVTVPTVKGRCRGRVIASEGVNTAHCHPPIEGLPRVRRVESKPLPRVWANLLLCEWEWKGGRP